MTYEMTYEQTRIVEIALRWLGRSTMNQIETERNRAYIHGLYMAAIVTRVDTADLHKIWSTAESIFLMCHKIPKLGVER